MYPNYRVACLSLECAEEARLGPVGRLNRAKERWRRKEEGIGNEAMVAANALSYMSTPVFGSSFLMAPHLFREGARVEGWVVDHRGKPVEVKGTQKVMEGCRGVLNDPNFEWSGVPRPPPPQSAHAFHSMTMNSPPSTCVSITSPSCRAPVGERLGKVKAAVFNVYSGLPKGGDYRGPSTAGLKSELGLSLDIGAWECALYLACTPPEVRRSEVAKNAPLPPTPVTVPLPFL